MIFDPLEVMLVLVLLMAVLMMVAARNADNMGSLGVLLIVAGLIFGWPFAAIGAVLLVAHMHYKREKL